MEYCGKKQDMGYGMPTRICGEDKHICHDCLTQGYHAMLNDMIRLKTLSRNYTIGEVSTRQLWREVLDISMKHAHGEHLDE